ncbi:hypothetical protein BK147_25060 [Paenibacillus sp. FSL R7-0337]|nr:hypothetical protein BK147_25060 [Paenibacillus sp. FSL R7-0337]
MQRLLLSEIHLGYITYGKTRTKRGQIEFVPEEEQIKAIGTHEKLKSQEEHEAIKERLVKNRLMNPNGRRNLFPLLGLLYFEKCGCKMQFRVAYSKSKGQYWNTLCYHHYKDGRKCEQKGKALDEEFFNALYDQVIQLDSNIIRDIEMHNNGFSDTEAIINNEDC